MFDNASYYVSNIKETESKIERVLSVIEKTVIKKFKKNQGANKTIY